MYSSGTCCAGPWEHCQEQGLSGPPAQSRQASKTDRPGQELMTPKTMTDCDRAREKTSRRWMSCPNRQRGCIFMAVREGLSEEASFQRRTEGQGRARHENSKREGVTGHGDKCKDQHTTKGAAAEDPACPMAHTRGAKLPPVSPARARRAPTHSGLCSPDNSKQTGLTLGLTITDWSWAGRAARHSSPGLCGTGQDGEGPCQERRLGPKGTQSNPARPAAPLGAEPGEF